MINEGGVCVPGSHNVPTTVLFSFLFLLLRIPHPSGTVCINLHRIGEVCCFLNREASFACLGARSLNTEVVVSPDRRHRSRANKQEGRTVAPLELLGLEERRQDASV